MNAKSMQDEKTMHIPDAWLRPNVSDAHELANSPGSYKLCFEVASGGMASVFLALYRGPVGFEKVVALKAIHQHLAKEQAFVDMFLDEARIAARIDHPHVCSVIDFGQSHDGYYIAMEYLVGEPLSYVWEGLQTAAPNVQADVPFVMARVAADLLEGLHAAHELSSDGTPLNLVHRDVTPANLFVQYDGSVRVVDFGIAQANGKQHHTEAGTMKGKYPYLSPEQLRMEPLDRRTDVWAMGVVLWELLTQQRLFSHESPLETMKAVAEAHIEPPSARNPEVPDELDRIVLKALSRKREDRYPNARAMSVALERFLGAHMRTVPKAEVSRFMSGLFPENEVRKKQLVELTRTGETTVPAAWQATSTPTNLLVRPVEAIVVPEPTKRPKRARAQTQEVVDGELYERDDERMPTESLIRAHQRMQGAPPELPSEPQDPQTPVPTTHGAEGATAANHPIASPKRAASLHPIVGLAAAAVVAASGFVVGRVAPAQTDARGGGPAQATQETSAQTTLPSASKIPSVDSSEGRTAGEPSAVALRERVPSVAQTEVSGDGAAAPREDSALRPVTSNTWSPWGDARPADKTASEAIASGEGKVRIVGAQDGWADVYIEGQKKGRTPLSVKLPAGRHQIVLRPFGNGAPRVVDVEIKAGRELNLNVTLPRP